jgi:epoxyqueuosine reductase
MRLSPEERKRVSEAIRRRAYELGFDEVGIAPAVQPPHYGRFLEWLEHGHAGEMLYLQRHATARSHPSSVLAEARSLVVVLLNYHRPNSLASKEDLPVGRIARYARIPDYHGVIRTRLRDLLAFVEAHIPGVCGRAVVDTAPLLERDFAQLAGLGWVGKNTMLLSKKLGSWTLLGALLLDVELDYDAPQETTHCGTCRRCLDACPTGALVEPYVLDSRQCISYLTIELRGPLPEALRSQLHGWLFGCDICQEVCPWNRKAPAIWDPERLGSDPVGPAWDPVEVLELPDEELRRRLRGTALERAGVVGLKRNAAVLIGSHRLRAGIPALIRSLNHPSWVLRSSAAWALGQLGSTEALEALSRAAAQESDDAVRSEIHQALERIRSAVSQTGPPKVESARAVPATTGPESYSRNGNFRWGSGLSPSSR